MGTCVESQGEASVPFPRPLSGGSWDLDHSEGMVPALCTQVFGMLFPAGVTCVDEVVGQLTTVRTPPTHKPPPPPPGLDQPARHTLDLNGQKALQGRQCLDRTQVLIRELRVRPSWEREQKVPVMCFRGILCDPPSEITGVTEGTGFGLPSSGTFMRRSKDVGLPRPTHYRKFPSCCWQISSF